MLFSCFVLVYLAQKRNMPWAIKYLLLLLAILIPTFFSAFRAESYRGDYASYLVVLRQIMRHVSSLEDIFVSGRVYFKEPGFTCILYLLSCIVPHNIFIFGVIYFVMLTSALTGLWQMRRIATPAVSYTFYLCVNLLFSWNGVRQAWGGAFALLGIGLLLNKKRVFPCILFIIIGTAVHLTTILFMIVPLYYMLITRRLRYKVIFIIFLAIIPFVYNLIARTYGSYMHALELESVMWTNIIKFFFIYLPPFVLLYYLQKRLNPNMLPQTAAGAMSSTASTSAGFPSSAPALQLSYQDDSDMLTLCPKIFICFMLLMLTMQIVGLFAAYVATRMVTLFYPLLAVIYAFIYRRCGSIVKVYLLFMIFYYYLFYCAVQTSGEYVMSLDNVLL